MGVADSPSYLSGWQRASASLDFTQPTWLTRTGGDMTMGKAEIRNLSAQHVPLPDNISVTYLCFRYSLNTR
jgi:hypothetical protein